ncbi:hypothetical protein AYL99_01590 [Fonsecaea erecta]|uniref:FAD/NAD(P)-binding domain-containing protein n=1 Tax=Fonsecaea erecta TaxID=1367422 RepID=A0A179A0J0_9EURO|nr:hypothetical protein AYL99_01590 [Fonsecaea erecta]OAP65618.1 hypothetical protein AYL99_01590 [Fonsecaea erecta]
MSPHKVDDVYEAPYKIERQLLFAPRKLRIVCIGAGASGMYMAIRQEQLLENVEFQIYEKNPDVAGTWFENKYPGAACDVPAHIYTFSFAPKTDWSHYYAESDEIQEYFSSVADKYRVRRFIKFDHQLVSAEWNEQNAKYELQIKTSNGSILRDECDILVNACGILNAWKWPAIPGLQDFQGELLHSANFDRSWTPDGRNVALIGTGSSAIQILPKIQPKAKHIDTYARSPTWIAMPFAGIKSRQPQGNPPYSDLEKEHFKNDPAYHLQYRCDLESEFNHYYEMFVDNCDLQLSTVRDLTARMEASLAKKPELIPLLIPKFGVGCRRLTPGVGYLEAMCEDNVEVVTQEITRVTADGVVSADGTERKVDTIICATGFDVSFTPRFNLTGKNGFKCDEKFGADPKGYMSLAIRDLPNYFIFNGPQACAANGSFLPVLEATADYILKCVHKIQTQRIRTMNPKQEAIDDLVEHVDTLMPETVWVHSCRSWYKNNTVDGRVTAVWPGSTLHFLSVIKEPRWEDYDYEYLGGKNRFSYFGTGQTKTEAEGGERAAHLRTRVHLFDEWWPEHEKKLVESDATA